MDVYRSHTDEYLFTLLQYKDEKAFTELYSRYWKKLLVRANILLYSQEDAEEAVHDIFVGLWTKKTQLHIRHSFHTYIAAMLKYSCFKILAKRRLRGINKTIEDLEAVDCTTQQWLDFEELQEELEMAVDRLPEKCQLVFRLSREKYLSDKEIADDLDISVNTVRTQMHRALQKLKASLSYFFFTL